MSSSPTPVHRCQCIVWSVQIVTMSPNPTVVIVTSAHQRPTVIVVHYLGGKTKLLFTQWDGLKVVARIDLYSLCIVN